MRVIDEQLKRAWWDNTFFYEILDSGDQLDGFGILRGPAPNYVEKPAYGALKNRLAKEPAFAPGSDDGAAPPLDLATARDLAPAPADGGLGPAPDLDGSGGLATGGCTCALGSRCAAAPRALIAAFLGLLLLRRRRPRSR